MASNLDAALALADQGFYVFPCRGKLPACKWRDDSTRDEAKIRQMWHNKEGLVAGIDLGKSGHIVIDCDVKNHDEAGRHGNDNFGLLCAENHFDMSRVPAVATPSGGTHFYFRQREGKERTNRTGGLPFGIDVRGNGGYVIAPGQALPEGKGEYILEAFSLDSLWQAPLLPDWLAGILDEGKEKEPLPPLDLTAMVISPPIERGSMQEVHLVNQAWKGIMAELAILEAAPKHTRNNTLNTVAFKIATMVAAGWVSQAETMPLISNSALKIGLPLCEINNTLKSAFNGGKQKPRNIPDSVLRAEEIRQEMQEISNVLYQSLEKKRRKSENVKTYIKHEDGTVIDEETGEIVEEMERQEPTKKEAVELDYPAGLVGEIAKWIVMTSRYPQPELAIGAALGIVGTVAGRQFSGPTKSATQLYILGLAPTGKGKDRPLKSIEDIMLAANMSMMLAAPEHASIQAVEKTLVKHPLSIAPMDEFGDFIRRINSKKGSTHENGISKVLRTLWSSSFDNFSTMETASRDSKTIVWPSLTIYGVSTPRQFYGALEGAILENGTLNRFLIINGRSKVAECEPDDESEEVPDAIIERLKEIHFYMGDLTQNVRIDWQAPLKRQEHRVVIGWCPDGAKEIYQAFSREISDLMDTRPEAENFYGRAAEMALRVATIIAIGRGAMSVSAQDMRYGIKIVRISCSFMEEGTADYMAENEHQANAQKIKRFLKAAGGRMKHSELLRKLDGSIRTYDLKGMIQILCESGILEREEVKPDGPGRGATWYQLKS